MKLHGITRIPFTKMLVLLLAIEGARVTATRGTFEKNLRYKIFEQNQYDKSVRPVKDHTKPIKVSFSLRLSKLVELNTKKQLLIIDVWIVQRWINPFLSWNESEHGGIHTLHIKPENMWVPDTVLYDNGDEDVSQAGFLEKFKTYVMLDSSGTCTWMAPTTFKSSCSMDITNFPFDSQTCEMTFGSWTFDNRLLVMEQLHDAHQRTEKYVSNGDWHLRDVTMKSRLLNYSCCSHPFSDVTYTFTLKRKPIYHVIYHIVPCVIISFLSLVSFLLPPDCGERIGLSITVLLAMSVYLLMVSDILPETSDFVPRLGMYYMLVMGELALVLTATAISIRCHFARRKPPQFIMRLKGQTNIIQPRKITVFSLDDVGLNNETNDSGKNETLKRESIKPTDHDKIIDEKEFWRECWMEFAHRLDIIFSIVFTIVFIVTTLVILLLRK